MCPFLSTFAWNNHNFTSNPSKRKTRQGTSTTPPVEVGALREAVAHQRMQLQEAKAITKQQGKDKELCEKDTEFQALKARLTGVGHPGALLAAALIPAGADWNGGEVWDVKKKGKLPGAVSETCVRTDMYVKPRCLSDGKEQWTELLQGEYGLQGSWLVLKPMAPAGECIYVRECMYMRECIVRECMERDESKYYQRYDIHALRHRLKWLQTEPGTSTGLQGGGGTPLCAPPPSC
jgi:hypothetical protein